MKTAILIALFAFITACIPYEDKLALTNSLIIGRSDQSDLYEWTCKTCDFSNKPIHSHIILAKSADIKCIVSVYDDFVILAFRYTNNILKTWKDILYPLQVILI